MRYRRIYNMLLAKIPAWLKKGVKAATETATEDIAQALKQHPLDVEIARWLLEQEGMESWVNEYFKKQQEAEMNCYWDSDKIKGKKSNPLMTPEDVRRRLDEGADPLMLSIEH